MVLTYNGVEVRARSIVRVPVYDDTGSKLLYYRYTVVATED